MTAPLPPADLNWRKPELVEISAGESLHQFYTVKHDPIFFDTSTTGRFNAPDASCGVLYAAKETAGAFAETFLREPGRALIDTDKRIVAANDNGDIGSPDTETLRNVNDVVLQIARLVGRRMAREDFAALTAANDNAPKSGNEADDD